MRHAYRFTFNQTIDLQEVQDTLLLSALAVQGLLGATRVQLELHYQWDKENRSCSVDAQGEVGRAVCQVFAELVTREFGRDAFTVHRIEHSEVETVGEPHH